MILSGNGANSLSERGILYKVLFEMRKDVNDLKKLVHQYMSGERTRTEIIEQNSKLFNQLKSDYESELTEEIDNLPKDEPTPRIIDPGNDQSHYELERVEDIEHEEDESLSIEKKEKELIIKALRKNSNKRKYAAQDLGISERTLYRKIKQFDLEDS